MVGDRKRALRWLCVLGVMSGVLPRAAGAQSSDPLEGRTVAAIHVTGVSRLSPEVVERHLATRVGAPFHRADLALDRRQLDELRLFSAVTIEPRLEHESVVLDVSVAETLHLLPVVVVSVTDENGVSAGPGIKTINFLGHGMQSSLAFRFGGETSVGASLDATTITPGTWAQHAGFSYVTRRNTIYDFDERSATAEMRMGRNWRHGLRLGIAASVMSISTGSSGIALSPDGRDLIPSLGLFATLDTLDSSTNPQSGTWAELQVDRLVGDAESWTFTTDARRFQRLSDRHGLGLFSLATFQTGEVGVGLPSYLQLALGGGNTVRGWELGSRSGRNQFIGTVEYSYVLAPVRPFSVAGLNLYGGLQVVGYADVGLAWTDHHDFSAGDAIDGYGVGLRCLVPFVDSIRLDVAWGQPGQGARTYFGVSLKAARQRQRVR